MIFILFDEGSNLYLERGFPFQKYICDSSTNYPHLDTIILLWHELNNSTNIHFAWSGNENLHINETFDYIAIACRNDLCKWFG
jgi:hypothetical protein